MRDSVMQNIDRIGGVILCGGKSSRMGTPKHLLPFGKEVVLQRVVRVLGEVVSPLVVVCAAGQELPQLPDSLRMIEDEEEYLGPLAGLVMGLKALAGEVDAVYLTGCDVPLLKAEFIQGMISKLGEYECVVAMEEQFLHPLAAVYRTSVLPVAEELLLNDVLRPRALIEACQSLKISVEELRIFDAELDSLRNMNNPDEYQTLLAKQGASQQQ